MAKPSADTESLLREAEESGNREAFKVLAKGKRYRASAGVRLDVSEGAAFFLEVLVYLCPPASKIRVTELEMKLQFMKALEARGYSLHCEDDGCVSLEATRPPQELTPEFAAIRSIASKTFRSE